MPWNCLWKTIDATPKPLPVKGGKLPKPNKVGILFLPKRVTQFSLSTPYGNEKGKSPTERKTVKFMSPLDSVPWNHNQQQNSQPAAAPQEGST